MILMFEAALHTAIAHADGYPAEDMGYGSGMGGWLAYIAEPLRRAPVTTMFTTPAHGTAPNWATKFGRAILHFIQPWGRNLSNTGDHGDDFGERGFVLARLAHQTNDPTLLWLLGTLYYPHLQLGARHAAHQRPRRRRARRRLPCPRQRGHAPRA